MAAFSDDFNRADSTDLGAGWVEVSGDWSIVSNQLSPGSGGGTVILRAAGAMDSSDNYAQATIAATTAASHGVWCRGNSSFSSGYLWRNDGTEWTLFSVVSSTFTNIGSYAAAAAPGDVAKVQAVGSTIKGYVNGVQRVSVTDTAVATGTSVGFRSTASSSIRFDDFTAADVTAGVALGAAAETDSAQALAGSKTTALGTATATEAAQALVGAKAALLGTAAQTETAQPLAGTASRALGTATTDETARPLTGAKSATLGTATETGTARPLTGSAGGGIDFAVGTPDSQWSAGLPPVAQVRNGHRGRRMDRSSLEELLTPITASSDPTGLTVRVAVLPDGERPDAGDWHVADWTTVDGTPHASLLVGPGGAVQLDPGVYRTWTEITAPPEKPVVMSARFRIT